MTEQEQLVAIAEACPKLYMVHRGNVYLRNTWEGDDCDADPLSDLNEMHEVEKVLGPVERLQYENWLAALRVNSAYTSSCTASQRAEAFLRTIGKWKD